jgi:hypothetical protein
VDAGLRRHDVGGGMTLEAAAVGRSWTAAVMEGCGDAGGALTLGAARLDLSRVAGEVSYSVVVFTSVIAAGGGAVAPCAGGGSFIIAPVIGMKNTPISRREWIFPASSLV